MQSTTERVLLWITKIALFVVPFVPLLIAQNMFFPYITGKAFVFRALVEVAFFAWIWLAIFNPKYRPRMTPLMWSVLLWVVVVLLATVFGENPTRSFWSNFERMEGAIAYLHLAMYFVVLSHILRRKDWMVFLHCSLVAGLLQGVYALFQKLGYLISPQGGFRTDGTIGNPTYLAAYLMFVVAFALLLWIYARNKWTRYYLLAATFFTLLIIYFTASRGPTLALLLGSIFAGGLFLIFMRTDITVSKRMRRAIFSALALLIIVPAGLWMARNTSFVRGSDVLIRLTSMSFRERTITSRFTIWNMSWEGFKEHPLLGWGPENYLVVFSKYYKTELWQQEPWFDRSHNIVFDWLINAGILGLISYFAMFVTGVGMLWKNFALAREAADKQHTTAIEYEASRELHAGIVISGLLFAYVLQNFFVFDNIATYTVFFALLAFIQSTAFAHAESFDERRTAGAPLVAQRASASIEAIGMVSAILVVGFTLTLYALNIRPLLVNLHLLNALKLQSAQDIQGAYDEYNNALSYDAALGRMEIAEQYSRFALAAGVAPSLTPEFRSQMLRQAIELADRVVTENPSDPRSRLFLAIILSKVGMYDKALEAFDAALKLAPMKHQVYFELADAYLQMGNTAKAVETMEFIYQKTKNFGAVGMNLAAVHILNGDQDIVDALLKEHLGTVDVADELLLRVYRVTGNQARIAGTLKAFIIVNPDDIGHRLQLASTYHTLGRNADAIRELETIIAKQPDFAQAGNDIIAKLRRGEAVEF
ncbi:MAG: O-antigen ligase family protein [bacterium]|nr:O-antigen ligase family protein [bacterium]